MQMVAHRRRSGPAGHADIQNSDPGGESFPEVPPRVEYSFTPFGMKFVTLLESLDVLEAELAGMEIAGPPNEAAD